MVRFIHVSQKLLINEYLGSDCDIARGLTVLITNATLATSFLADRCNATFGYCHEMSVCRL